MAKNGNICKYMYAISKKILLNLRKVVTLNPCRYMMCLTKDIVGGMNVWELITNYNVKYKRTDALSLWHQQ